MSYSELERLSFEQLYERYDSSRDETEKQLIKQVVEDKEPPPPDPNFQPYPQTNDPQLQDILFKKKEFNSNQLFLDSMNIEDPCHSDFMIKPHQIVLKNFMNKESPYHSLLVYHGVGVGKTCSGLTIAENFRDVYARKDRRILILCSKNIQIGWKQTIYTPDRGSNQCTGDAFTSSDATTQRETNKLIKQYYEIMAYQSFSNFVKRKQLEHIQSLPEEEKEQGKQRWIHSYFSDRLMVIDEAHNIRDDQGKEMRDAVKTIEDVLKYSENLRLVLLTATPMYNRASEIIWMLNMMLLNDKKTPIDKKGIFTKDGELTERGQEIIEEKSKGYVSYLRGENPITFPLRLSPICLKNKNGREMFPTYTKQTDTNIIFKSRSPKLNLVGGQIKSQDKFKFLELFGSRLRGLQELVYNQSIQNMIDSTPDLDIDVRGEKNSILDNILLTQITNFVYPASTSKTIRNDLKQGSVKVDDFYGANGIRNSLQRKGQTFAYKNPKYPFFDRDFIGDHSAKMLSILDAIDNTEGIVFVYTNYVDAGIIPLQLMLEHNGYKRFDKRKVLSFPEYKGSVEPHKCKREPISYNGVRKSDAGEEFKQATFMVIDGSTNKKDLSDQLKIISSKSNMNGGRIKVILGTVVASEGLDFKRIRSIHIVDPWVHLNRLEQTVGRGIRFCSHADLPDENKNVLTYFHVTTLRDDRETIDSSIYRYAEKKSVEIGKVETILKKNAIDRNLYEDVNVILKGSLNRVFVKPPIYQAKQIKVDPTDKAYTKVCSYMPDCNYNADIDIDYDVTLNRDTFLERYSRNAIQNIKQKISLLFKDFYVFRISSIVGLMNEYGFSYDDMIYQALSEMIEDKYILVGKNNAYGYIINRANYYIFQPFLYEDSLIPLQYRSKLLQIPQRVIKLDKITTIDDKPEYSQRYTQEYVESVYSNSIETILESYNSLVDLVDILTDVYSELTMNDISVLGFLFDRLSFTNKCSLMYSHIQNMTLNEIPAHDIMKQYISTYCIYKSQTSDDYYFGKEHNFYKPNNLFGFYITYRNKPYFFEMYEGIITPCDQVQQTNIDKSLKRYKSSSIGKSFAKTSPMWGYTIERKKGKINEVVMKFVSPENKDAKYPPGPGNVCIENNIGSSKEKIKLLIEQFIPEIIDIVEPMYKRGENSKVNLCTIIELVLRHKRDFSFYPVDSIWMKYL